MSTKKIVYAYAYAYAYADRLKRALGLALLRWRKVGSFRSHRRLLDGKVALGSSA